MTDSRSNSPHLTRNLVVWLLWALVAVGFAAALNSAKHRYDVEKSNRRVEITLDWAEVRSLAAAEGVPVPEVLRQFQLAGTTSVAVTEDTVGSLEDARRLRVARADADSTVLGVAGTPVTHTGVEDIARVAESLRVKTRYPVAAAAEIQIGQPWALVRGIGVGLDPEILRDVRGAGLGVVGRVANWRGVRPGGVVWTLDELKQQGVHSVIFSGDEVLGFEGYVADDPKQPGQKSTAAALRDFDLTYGSVEFGKQKGDALLAKAAADRLVRVHTITGAEMLNADVPANVQRFSLAARERNIRLLYVRLFPDEPDALAFNTRYVAKIAASLERGGLATGKARGYPPLGTGTAARLVISLGIAAGFLLLLHAVTGVLNGGAGAIPVAKAAIGVPLIVLAAVAPVAMGPKVAALAAACIFPALGLLRADLLAPAPPGASPGFTALGRFAAACAVTLLGAGMIVGMLADRAFLLKIDSFVGVKPAHLIPVLLVALVAALNLRAGRERPFREVLAGAGRQIAGWMGDPVRVWQVVAAVAVVAALGLLVLRSGNEGNAAVSGLELKIRSVLDRLLYARPRFKEFLIGHPALFVSLALAARGHWRWALPLFVLGAVGQVSLLNTFCHLHTPVPVSLWRALLGIGIGVIIGWAAWAVLDRLFLSP
ncbi:MAG TPA: DUF5693 family protein, partial [Armatimonadaceae bacterium]|nr:DUF5693 family protein [Armatimonadaceae bacterium]